MTSPDAPPTDDPRNQHWQRAFTERASEHWTPQRTAELASGKALLLPPGEAAPLLRAMGLLHRDASMPPRQVRKYWQVSHMVTLLGASVRALLAAHGPVTILDAGCGRSYLSMALAWVAEHRWGGQVRILGVDRNPDVIEACRQRSQQAGLAHALTFRAAALEDLRDHLEDAPIHALLSLHACDTATCDALALAVQLKASLVAVAPCCQAELARGWAGLAARYDLAPPATPADGADGADGADDAPATAFRTIWATPHLRRETAADLTDAMRALLLRACGYRVSAIEFVPAEHTRKNTLLRGEATALSAAERAAPVHEYRALVAATGGVGLGLERVLGLADA